jgi:hypothetical protein
MILVTSTGSIGSDCDERGEKAKGGPLLCLMYGTMETPCFTFPQFECMLQFELGDSALVFSHEDMI